VKAFKIPPDVQVLMDRFTGDNSDGDEPQFVPALDLRDLEKWNQNHNSLAEELHLGACRECCRVGKAMLKICRDIASGKPAPSDGGRYWTKIGDYWFGFQTEDELWEALRKGMAGQEMVQQDPRLRGRLN